MAVRLEELEALAAWMEQNIRGLDKLGPSDILL